MLHKIGKNDGIEIVFADGIKTATAFISQAKIKELLLDEAYDIITTPECDSSSCAVNNFCECSPINGDMEFAGIFVRIVDGKQTDDTGEVKDVPTKICLIGFECERYGKKSDEECDGCGWWQTMKKDA